MMELTPGVIVTAGIAALAFAAQWGHSTALLNAIYARLNELLKTLGEINETQKDHADRLTKLEVQCHARHKP